MKSITNRILKGSAFFALLVASLIASSSSSLAQRGVAGLSFITGFPEGEFKENMRQTGFGISGYGGYHFGEKIPLMVGAEFGAMTYGNSERTVPFSTTIPDVKVDVSTSHNIAKGHLFVRLQPGTGIVRPYVDGVFGGSYLYTQTTIEDRGRSGWGEDWDDNIATSTNYDDWAWSYGGGGGVTIQVFNNDDFKDGPDSEQCDGIGEGYINIGVRYLSGSEASYLKTGGVHRENGGVRYDVTTSRTDMITGQIGFEMHF